MQALHQVLSSQIGSPSIFWAHFNNDPEVVKLHQSSIFGDLNTLALSRDGFLSYYGINVNEFLPRLFDLLGRSGFHDSRLSVPSADEKTQPPARRVLAFAADDGSQSSPLYPDCLWGTDRGRFMGLLSGSTDAGVYESLVQIEGRIQREIQHHPELTGLPVRWWLRLDASRLTSRSNPSEALENAIVDLNDPRHRYMRTKGLPQGIQLGAFIEMPEFVGTEQSLELLRRCIEHLESAVGFKHLLGIVARWRQAPLHDFKMLLEISKYIWPTLAVDGLIQVEEHSIARKAAHKNGEFHEWFSDGSAGGHWSELMSGAARAVDMYAHGKLSEDAFLHEQGIHAFSMALRRGINFPTAVTLSSQIDLSCSDFWWLVTRLEPSPSRLHQIFSLPASRRAVWGLGSLIEWNSFEDYIKAQILDVRQGRSLVLE